MIPARDRGQIDDPHPLLVIAVCLVGLAVGTAVVVPTLSHDAPTSEELEQKSENLETNDDGSMGLLKTTGVVLVLSVIASWVVGGPKRPDEEQGDPDAE